MRTVLGPLTTARVPEDTGILVDELLGLVSESIDEHDLMEGLADTFSLEELEQLADEMAAAPPRPSRPRGVKNTVVGRGGVAKTHAEAFQRVRRMR